MVDEKQMLVTTDGDYWNSADGANFYVLKGQVKPLPSQTTPIIEDALEQGLLREATPEEISKYNYEQGMEEALRTGAINPGKSYRDTVAHYQQHLDKKPKVK
jgi:hypothetical protein